MGKNCRKLTLKSSNPQIALMRNFFTPAEEPNSPSQPTEPEVAEDVTPGHEFLPAELRNR